jgi:hypothetical protein
MRELSSAGVWKFTESKFRKSRKSGSMGRSGVAAKAESTGSAPEQSLPTLGEREQRILVFERQWWRHAGAKEEAIRSEFGLSAARYYQVLNALLDSPAAIVSDPMLVKRLRRLRDARTSARSARVIGDTTPGRGLTN